MPDLRFSVLSVEPAQSAAVPTLLFRLRIENAPAEQRIQSALLRCQIQIEPGRRQYSRTEQEHLYELFDRPERWGQTLQPLLWTNVVTVVPSFAGDTVVEVPVACSFDFTVAATKYFHGVESGDVMLSLQFSGTVFYEAADGRMQVAQLPWDRDATYRLPVEIWKRVVAMYYPNCAWLCLRDDLMERLNDYKTRRGLPSFDAALEAMLAEFSPKVNS